MEEQVPPRVTALVVSRNGEADVRRCLESLERSTHRDRLEILVVDDGSRDGTASVADDFSDVISLKLPKQFGWTRAVNIGLRTAKGDLVLLLPPWFAVEPATISALADRLEASNDVGAVLPAATQAWAIPTPAALDIAWKSGHLPDPIPLGDKGEHSVDYPKGSPFLTRRELLRNMNYLDERFGDRWADLEMCSRIRSAGKAILVLAEVPVQKFNAPPEDVTQLEWADSANGVATYIGLHYGAFRGFTARLSMAFHALGRGKTSAFTGILTGAKIDGNQE
jgi:N-acetylglucosaminyl-diphospho-decaprenol L-rhamnosyltransferase